MSHKTNITFYDSPNFNPKNRIEASSIFLAGPILGTDDWQTQAKEYLAEGAKLKTYGPHQVDVYNPRRPQFTDLKDFTDETFFEQVDWEHNQLQLVSLYGVTLFWLANKTKDMPHRNYALTTLFELGEVIGRCTEYDMTGLQDKLVVGIEPGFTNEKYLRHTIARKAPWAVITDNLKDACNQALDML